MMKHKNTKSKPSLWYSSISMAIVLFLLGLFILTSLHSANLSNILKEKIKVIVELNDGSKVKEVENFIYSFPETRQGSVILIPKEKALRDMEQLLDLTSLDENPFLDILTFNVKASDYSPATINKLANNLSNHPNVIQVYAEDLTIENINKNLNRFSVIILTVGLIFVFLAIIIIRNTINLNMYADRWEIKTMELVGARWNFIKMPYIKSGIIVGIRAFIIALGIIGIMMVLLKYYVPLVWEVFDFFYLLLAILTIFILAVIVPAFTTNTAANKYLKGTVDQMFE